MKYVFYCLFFLAFASSISVAQERKFGDVTKEELAATSDDVFPDESAIILYREIEFEYGKTLWVHERIKILNKEGFDYSDWTISFDDIRQLKAVTYNLVDGKIEETKVGKQSIFVEEVDKDNEISKLAFPNVKEGSIIELKYKVIFIGLSALYTQMKLPIKYERISVSNGYYGQLSVRQNQYVQLPIKRLQAAQTDIFVGENVPGLKDEEFVGNINNHRGSILMELHRTNYVQTWTEVAKKFYEAEWFGAQMRNGDALYKKDLESLLAGVTDTLTMVKMVDRYVKDKIEWDQTYSRGTEYVKSVYRDEKGDSGDINLLLVHMLKSLGIRADPILVATKNKGWVNYPKAEEFNAVLCAVDVGNMRYILDGSVKETAFAQLPLRYINGTGLIVRTDAPGFDLQEVTIVQPTNQMVIATANIHPEKLAVSGNVNQRLTNYFALSHRRKYTDVGQNRYANYLSDVSLLNVSNITDENFDDINEPIKLSYDYEQSDYIEEIAGDLYLQPLLHFGVTENIFKEEDRLYPVDISHPYGYKFIITYNIPEGYAVSSLPESRLVKMEENIGYLKFDTLQRGNTIQVSFTFDIKHHLIPANYYPALKALYGEYVKISNSKIVLQKTI